MNRLIFLFVIFSLQPRAQTVQSTCNTSDSIRYRYRVDALRLALRKTNAQAGTFKDSISIDRSLTNQYYQALLAVYNATMLPIRDTVVKFFPVKTNLSPEMFQVNVLATGTLSWMQSLFNSQVPTGNPQIDAYLSKYSLFPIAYFSGTPDMVILRTDSAYNMKALAGSVKTVSNVIDAMPDSRFYDVYDITDNSAPGYIGLSYSYGWQDCNTGCKHRIFWNFRIYDSCRVEYMGHSGEPLFAGFANQPLSPGPEVKVFPQPTITGKINLEFAKPSGRKVKVVLYDVLGNEVFSQEISRQSQEVDPGELRPGVYLLVLKEKDRTFSMKLMKCD
jgi:hypothetical protein